MSIKYKKGYKYWLQEDELLRIPIRPGQNIDTGFIELTIDGDLTIRKGYAWDGPSGPAFDTKTFMRASLVHDALYQLMRIKRLDAHTNRPVADQIMKNICREDGMCKTRAWWAKKGVRLFGGRSTKRERKIYEAP